MDPQILAAIITAGVALVVGLISLRLQLRTNDRNHKTQMELEAFRQKMALEKIKFQDDLSIKSEERKKLDELKRRLNELAFIMGQEFSELESRWGLGTFREGVKKIRELMLKFSQVILTSNDCVSDSTISEFTKRLSLIDGLLDDSINMGTGSNLVTFLKPIKNEILELRVQILELKTLNN